MSSKNDKRYNSVVYFKEKMVQYDINREEIDTFLEITKSKQVLNNVCGS